MDLQSTEAECPSENQQLSLNPKDDSNTVCKHETYEQESTHQIDEKEHPIRKKKVLPRVLPHQLTPPPPNSVVCVHSGYWLIMTSVHPVLKIPWMLKT